MTKFIETLNNLVKLISSLLTLAVLGGALFGGLWLYHQVGILTSKPIVMPTITLPEIKLPEIKMPEIKVGLPEIKVPETLKEVDRALGRWQDKITGQEEKIEEGVLPGQWNFKGIGKLNREHEEKQARVKKMSPRAEIVQANPCDHNPKCRSALEHGDKKLLDLCNHSPACQSVGEFTKEHGYIILASCEHTPTCTHPYIHIYMICEEFSGSYQAWLFKNDPYWTTPKPKKEKPKAKPLPQLDGLKDYSNTGM